MLRRFEHFTKDIAIIYRQIQRIKEFETKELGLKCTHVNCLHYLYKKKKGLTSLQLIKECNEDKSAVSRAVKDLKAKNLVTYNQNENVNVYRGVITLTEEGLVIGKALSKRIEKAVEMASIGLTESERVDFLKTLNKISKNLCKYENSLQTSD